VAHPARKSRTQDNDNLMNEIKSMWLVCENHTKLVENLTVLFEQYFKQHKDEFPFNWKACCKHAAKDAITTCYEGEGNVNFYSRSGEVWSIEEIQSTGPEKITGRGTPWETSVNRARCRTWAIVLGPSRFLSAYDNWAQHRVQVEIKISEWIDGIHSEDGFTVCDDTPVVIQPFMSIGVVPSIVV